MKILAIGDVCADGGCDMLLKTLPRLRRELGIDLTVVNGENSDRRGGISPESAGLILNAGADVITGGNHTLHRRDIRPLLDENERLLRPHNIPDANYGCGYCLVDLGRKRVAVINLLGQIYLDMHRAENPFETADRLIEKARNDGADITVVDIHAEATSEKRALGYYLDGRVSAVFGTHTHVQTNDCQVLPRGTGYITDLGMTGPLHSVLGVDTDIIIDRLKNGGTGRFLPAGGKNTLQGAVFEIDDTTGLALRADTVNIQEF